MKKFSEYFKRVESDKEDEGRYRIESEAPDVLWSLHRDCVGICSGDLWASTTMSQAFDDLEENGNNIEDINIEPDPYYRRLDEWFSSCNEAAWLCNEAVEEGIADGKDIYKTIGAGQYLAKRRIYDLVHEFLTEQKGGEE